MFLFRGLHGFMVKWLFVNSKVLIIYFFTPYMTIQQTIRPFSKQPFNRQRAAFNKPVAASYKSSLKRLLNRRTFVS